MMLRSLGRVTGGIFMAAGVNHFTPFLPWWGQLLTFLAIAAFAEWGLTGRLTPLFEEKTDATE